MLQMDDKGNFHPTKCFPCACGSEGLIVSVQSDETWYQDEGSPFIDIAFWEFNPKLENKRGLTRWERIKYVWGILRGRSPWADMVGMNSSTARNFANHILYLLNKAREKKNSSPPLIDWPKNEEIRKQMQRTK